MDDWRTISSVYGVIAPTLQSLVASRITDMVAHTLNSATERWAGEGWHRCNNDEINCTVQLYRFMREVARTSPELRILSIRLEAVQLSPAILQGLEPASAALRPDIEVAVGEASSIIIECKRLSLKGNHPRDYVYLGMARYVTGAYAAEEPEAVMIGYVQADDPAEIVSEINRHVAAHAQMGPGEILRGVIPLPFIKLRYYSKHARPGLRPLTICHYHLDLRE